MNSRTFCGSLLCIGAFTLFADEAGTDTTKTQKVKELDKIVVTGTRRRVLQENTPEVSFVLESREIDDLFARDVSDALDYLPGISTEGGTGGGLPFKKTVTMNGMPVNYSLVMVDGTRLLSSHIHTGVNTNLVPAANIDRIEIVKGAASAQYGSDALGGVMNIITKKGTDAATMDFHVSGGSQRTLNSGLSIRHPVGEKVKNSMFVSWEQSDGLPIIEPKKRVDLFNYNTFNLMERMDFTVSEKMFTYAALHYNSTEAPFSIGGVKTLQESFLFTPSAGIDFHVTENWDLHATAYYTQWNNEKNNELNEITSPEVSLSFRGFQNHILIGGLQYEYRRFARKMVDEHYQHGGSFFLQDEYTPIPRLTFLGALRIDEVVNPGDTIDNIGPVVSPKLSLLFKVHDKIRTRLSVGRGFKAPTVQDLYESLYGHADDNHFRAGNEDLQPEYSTNFTGGIEMKIRDAFSIMLNGYYNTLTDMITPVDHGLEDPRTYDPVVGEQIVQEHKAEGSDTLVYIYQRENIHRAMVTGGEIMAEWKIAKGYRLDLGYSLVHNENRDTDESLPYYPGQTFFVKCIGEQPIHSVIALKGFFGLKSTFGRQIWKYKRTGSQIVELADYQKIDAGLSLKLYDQYEVFLSGRNLLAQELHLYEDKELITEGRALFEAGIRAKVF